MLVEDVVDTGLTLAYLLGELRQRGPASLEVCALIDKRARRIVPVPCGSSGRPWTSRSCSGTDSTWLGGTGTSS